MAYIQSTGINVFPTTKRDQASSGDTYSQYFTEYNITNVINRLINTDAFVITNQNSTNINGQNLGSYANLEFNIGGYYFNIKNENLKEIVEGSGISDSSPYFVVKAAINTSDYGVKTLIPLNTSGEPTNAMDSLDLNSQFQGLYFYSSSSYVNTSTQNSNGNTIYTLTLLQRLSSENYVIPRESKVKFKTPILTIDDGEL